MIVTLIQVFLYLSNTSHLCSRSLHMHFHINMWIYSQLQFPISLNSSGYGQYDNTSGFAINRLLVGYRRGNSPILIIFLKTIPNIDKIPGRHNQYPLISQIDKFSGIIKFLLTFIDINIRIEWFLQFEIILHFIIELVCGGKYEAVYEDICLIVLRLLI